jgi:hypothetical protein
MATYWMYVQLVDSAERLKRMRVQMAEQLDLAAYLAVGVAFLTELQVVTDLGVVRWDFVVRDASAGFAATAGSNIDTGATFVGYLADKGGMKATLKIPGIKMSFVQPGGRIPVADADIEDVLELFLEDASLLLSDGEEIESWIAGTLDK